MNPSGWNSSDCDNCSWRFDCDSGCNDFFLRLNSNIILSNIVPTLIIVTKSANRSEYFCNHGKFDQLKTWFKINKASWKNFLISARTVVHSYRFSEKLRYFLEKKEKESVVIKLLTTITTRKIDERNRGNCTSRCWRIFR